MGGQFYTKMSKSGNNGCFDGWIDDWMGGWMGGRDQSRCRQGSALRVIEHSNFKLNNKIKICTDFKQILKN